MQMVGCGEGSRIGPVQSVGVLTVDAVAASSDTGLEVLPGEGGILEPSHVRSASMSHTLGVPSLLIGL